MCDMCCVSGVWGVWCECMCVGRVSKDDLTCGLHGVDYVSDIGTLPIVTIHLFSISSSSIYNKITQFYCHD